MAETGNLKLQTDYKKLNIPKIGAIGKTRNWKISTGN